MELAQKKVKGCECRKRKPTRLILFLIFFVATGHKNFPPWFLIGGVAFTTWIIHVERNEHNSLCLLVLTYVV